MAVSFAGGESGFIWVLRNCSIVLKPFVGDQEEDSSILVEAVLASCPAQPRRDEVRERLTEPLLGMDVIRKLQLHLQGKLGTISDVI